MQIAVTKVFIVMGRADEPALTWRASILRVARAARLPKESRMGLMSLIWMIIVGFVVGVLARWLYPGTVALGFWATAIVGIVGSLVGGVIGALIWRSTDGRFHPAGLVLSVVGALAVLWIYLTYFAKT
jgi:uncharacterized membrane protein YeaQ/YmgE (transglycosylase-associated protein family)